MSKLRLSTDRTNYKQDQRAARLGFVTKIGFIAALFSLAAVFASGQTAPSGPVPAGFFGVHLIEKSDWPTISFGALGKPALTKWVYVEQTKGVFNWSNLDAWVAQANNHGVPIVWSMEKAPPWAVSDTSTCTTAADGVSKECSGAVTDLAGLHDFIVQLVTRYDGNHGHGRINAYELFDEPDNFYSGTMSQFVQEVNQIYNDIRSTDPTATIVGIGLDVPDTYFNGTSSYMDRFWQNGGTKGMDVISFHGYPHHDNNAPETINTYMSVIKACLSRNGISPTKPIWDTEGSWGDPTYGVTSSDAQVAFVARHYLLHWSNGVARYEWYAYDNSSWGPLWSSSGGVNAAGVAYQQVYKWMVGNTMTQPCTASGTIWTCVFSRPDGTQAMAVWNTAGSSYYTPPSTYTSYRTLTGGTGTVTSTLTIGIKPILLESTSTSTSTPVASLTVTPQTGAAPLYVTADSSASYETGGSIASRTINFGDGATATTTTATHTYSTAGTYTVTLTVKDSAGKTASTSKTVTVSASTTTLTPVASLTVTPQTGTAPLYVTADSSGSYESGGTIASRTISFGDGTTATTTTATHTYSTTGTYTVTLTVKDSAGTTASTSKTVIVSAPASSGSCTGSTTNRTVTICSLTPGSTVSSPVTVSAKATDSNRVQGMSIYVDGKKVYTKSQTSSVDTVLAMASGNRRVTVQAKDATGYFQSTVYITVK